MVVTDASLSGRDHATFARLPPPPRNSFPPRWAPPVGKWNALSHQKQLCHKSGLGQPAEPVEFKKPQKYSWELLPGLLCLDEIAEGVEFEIGGNDAGDFASKVR